MYIFRCMLIIPFICAALAADIVPVPGSQPITPVFASADLVCKCLVKRITVVAEQPIKGESFVRRLMRAQVEVKDLYKAEKQESGSILVEFGENWPASTVSEPGLWQGETALLFLKATGQGTYVFADRFLGATPFKSLPQQIGDLGLPKLRSALLDSALRGNRDDQIRALQLLHGFDSFDADSILNLDSLLNPNDPEIGFSALAVVIKANPLEGVERLRSYLDSYEGDAQPMALVNIETDLSLIRDDRTRLTLEALSVSRYVSIREGAVQALRGIKDPRSGPALAKRLDDPNSTIQYLAVISMAEIFGKYDGDYAPSMYLFDKNPEKYIELWKQWWADREHKP